MKIDNVLRLTLASVLFLLMAGCGGSSSSSSNNAVVEDQPQGLAMVLNQEYQVATGDVLIPKDEATRIAVRHVYLDDKKYVTLVAGSAVLVYGTDSQR